MDHTAAPTPLGTPDRSVTQRLLAGCLIASFAAAAPPVNAQEGIIDVTEQVSVKYSTFRYDRRTKTFATLAHVNNLADGPLFGPLSLVVTNISPSGAELVNADGVDSSGDPFVAIPLSGMSLRGGGGVGDIPLRFNNPTRTRIEFAYRVTGIETVLFTPEASVSALQSESTTAVLFAVRTEVTDRGDPLSVSLRRVDAADATFPVALNDSGVGGDAVSGDGVYSARVALTTGPVDTTQAPPCLEIEAVGDAGKGEIVTPLLELCVTSFNPSFSPSNLDNRVVEEQTVDGPIEAVADELLLRVVPETSDDDVEQAASAVGAVVVGALLPLDLYQLRFPAPLTAAELFAAIDVLEQLAGVESAYTNRIGELADCEEGESVTCQPAAGDTDPDPCLAQQQPQLTAIGLPQGFPQAWNYSQGANAMVALVDTGGRDTHEDLIGQNLPEDTDSRGHGTHLAGIIAATRDNGRGIAGVAPAANLKIVKAADESLDAHCNVELSELDQDLLNLTSGTSTIVNVSLYQFGLTNEDAVDDLCKAVDILVSGGTSQPPDTLVPRRLVVAAAGNESGAGADGAVNRFRYPAACNANFSPDVDLYNSTHRQLILAVTASTPNGSGFWANSVLGDHSNDDDNPSSTATWVDLVAPGQDVLSTSSDGTDTYERQSGTSQATAIASGAAALVLSRRLQLDESLSSALNQVEVDLRSGPLDPLQTPNPNANSIPRLDVLASLRSAGDNAPTCGMVIADSQGNTLTPSNGTVAIDLGDALSFAATASDPDNDPIDSYEWDFAGQSTSNLQNPGAVTFSSAGLQQIDLTVTDRTERICEFNVNVNVQQPPPAPPISAVFDDATGDETNAAFDPANCCDLTTVSATIENDELVLVAQLTNYQQGISTPSFELDTDSNLATGHPGTTAGGVIDAGLLGVDYFVRPVSIPGTGISTTQARVARFVSFNSFQTVGTVPITQLADGLEVRVPLTLIGDTDRSLNFKVTAFGLVDQGPPSFTTIRDSAPDFAAPAIPLTP